MAKTIYITKKEKPVLVIQTGDGVELPKGKEPIENYTPGVVIRSAIKEYEPGAIHNFNLGFFDELATVDVVDTEGISG